MSNRFATAVITYWIVLPAAIWPQGATPPAPKPAAGAKPAAAKPTTARPATPVDKVVEMLKLKTREDLIIRAIVKDNMKADLGVNDMLRLKQAGASDGVISVMMDPSSVNVTPSPTAPQPTATLLPTAAAASSPTPVPATAPAATGGWRRDEVLAPKAQQRAAPAQAPDPKAQQRTAAIDEFNWAAVKKPVQEIFNTDVDIGKGIRSLLTTRLQEGGKIRVVERAKIQTVMQEQDVGAGNRVKQGTNARIGQIRGADVYVMGDIVAFGRDDRDKRIGLGTWIPKVGEMIKIGQKEEKAVVVINYRLVDAETSEVISTGVARGESNRKSKGLVGIGVWPGGIVGGAVDMTSTNFAETIIGEATMDACNKLAAIMNDKVPGLPRRQIDVEAYVADVTGSTVTLAAGSSSGISAGDHFEVFHVLSEIKDPITGEVLDQKVEKSGELMIDSVREKVASGQYRGAPVAVKTYLARKVLK